ncbi:MAG TPA: AMP-binding protein, partial [Candidatus Methylomirabilis sp.]|nr:AMP-binding protein [Candidatus Methylomirabilis sp.]
MASADADALPFTPEDVDRSLPERFARVAARWPSRPAIVAGNRRLTYRELDRRSDRLAGAIAALDSGGQSPVAVLTEDRVSTPVGILAAWKAGRLCVPLDGALPPSRLHAILSDCEADVVVTDGDGAAALAACPGRAAKQLRVDDPDLGEP